jgi:hypothetical protein
VPPQRALDTFRPGWDAEGNALAPGEGPSYNTRINITFRWADRLSRLQLTHQILSRWLVFATLSNATFSNCRLQPIACNRTLRSAHGHANLQVRDPNVRLSVNSDYILISLQSPPRRPESEGAQPHGGR